VLDSSLKGATISPAPPLPTCRSLNLWFKTNLDQVTAQLAHHTPVKGVTFRSKPWWSELLSQLRRAYTSALRSSKRDRLDTALLASARTARSAYFKAIKKAKRDHWSDFLASATPETVWTAKRFAVGPPPPRLPGLPGATTPLELNKALLNHFFPGKPVRTTDSILLPFRDCPALTTDEVGWALARSSPSSASGPDKTPNSVWKRITRVAPHLILDLLAPLVAHGFQPPALKMADGIVLDKPGKPSYDSPDSFPAIVLLQTFSKILERIMNSRLSCVACLAGLLNPHQCGSLACLSASDATTTMTHEIGPSRWLGRKFPHSSRTSKAVSTMSTRLPSPTGSNRRVLTPTLCHGLGSSSLAGHAGSSTRDHQRSLPRSRWEPPRGPRSPPSSLSSKSPACTARSPRVSRFLISMTSV